MTRESEDRHRLGENALQDTQMTKDPCTKYERIFKTIIKWTTQFLKMSKRPEQTPPKKKIYRWQVSIDKHVQHVMTLGSCNIVATKATMRYYYIPIRMAKIQTSDNIKCW